MNERKLLIDTDTRHTTSSALQHSESFTSLTPFVGKIKIEHFSFLRWLVNFDSHCISVSLVFFGAVKAAIGRCKATDVDGTEASVFD